jgi:hypothetical protein
MIELHGMELDNYPINGVYMRHQLKLQRVKSPSSSIALPWLITCSKYIFFTLSKRVAFDEQ